MSDEEVWQLPGPKNFLRRVVGSVSGGACCAVVLPSTKTPPGVGAELARTFSDRAISPYPSHVSTLWPALTDSREIEATGPRVIAELLHLDFDPGSRIDAPAVAGHHDREREVVIVDACGRCPDDQEAVSSLLTAFAAANNTLPISDRLGFVAILDDAATAKRIVADLTVIISWWWGVVGPLDAHVWASRLGVVDTLDRTVLTELGGWDFELLERLAAPGTRPVDGIESLAYGGDLPIHLEGETARDTPPDHCLELWSRGLAQSWAGRIRLAPGLLRETRTDLLRRREWMAQVAVFFPEIEIARSRLANAVLVEATRRGLPRESEGLDGEVVPIDELEIGALGRFVRGYRSLQLGNKQYDAIFKLRDARNALAHLDPLSPKRVKDLQATLRSVR